MRPAGPGQPCRFETPDRHPENLSVIPGRFIPPLRGRSHFRQAPPRMNFSQPQSEPSAIVAIGRPLNETATGSMRLSATIDSPAMAAEVRTPPSAIGAQAPDAVPGQARDGSPSPVSKRLRLMRPDHAAGFADFSF